MNYFHKHTKKQSGFTLIEVSLFMGLFSVILVILLQIFTSIVDKQIDVQSSSAVVSDQLFILSRLKYDIERATSITTPATPGDQGNTLTLVIDGQNYTYAVLSGNLQLTTPSGTQNINGFRTSISGLNFLRLGITNGKNNIQLALDITSRISRPEGPETQSISTTIGTR